jgi:hypothetical protein
MTATRFGVHRNRIVAIDLDRRQRGKQRAMRPTSTDSTSTLLTRCAVREGGVCTWMRGCSNNTLPFDYHIPIADEADF